MIFVLVTVVEKYENISFNYFCKNILQGVVTLATYSFFIAAIVGRQFVEKSPIPYKKMIDLYVPFFTLLQFFFYMGLLKTDIDVDYCSTLLAELMIYDKCFGEDM
ncbi:Bestrophin-3 [Armadillidium nasatum]|uniref:Bestrophin homolog n=1 Tax=Armadillidium nasatum TaxID=96803 RepID=A0A5N5T642_9CRUS|nr:Bestrophin-3 [Armadillidium nasatum]